MVRSNQENYDLVYVMLSLIENNALPEKTARRLTDRIVEALRPDHKKTEDSQKWR